MECGQYVIGYDNSKLNGLTSLDMTWHNHISSITDSAFRGCNEITSFIAPESLVNIGINAFRGCKCLKEVDLEKATHLKKIDRYAFKDCISLEVLKLPVDFHASLGKDAFSGTKVKD